MTECSFCGSNEYTDGPAAVTCMSCTGQGLSFALSKPKQCTTANTIIVGSIVGGVLVVVVVTLVLVLVFVNPKRLAKRPEATDAAGSDICPSTVNTSLGGAT